MAATAGLKAKKILTPHDKELGSLPFRLDVSYRIPLAEAVELGRYELVDKAVFKLPLLGSKETFVRCQAHLVNESGLTDGDELEGRIHFLRHACIEELLAFGYHYPEAQRLFPIVAFGSTVRIGSQPGVRQTPYLAGNAGERRLCMGARDFAWSNAFCFLMIACQIVTE